MGDPSAKMPDFGPRYLVISRLGAGGMGDVYRAFDNELNADVALKVVRDDSEAAIARFQREIALARKVTSPNVLRVYDLDEYEGVRFLSMEYVDGEDLAKLLRREGKLPLDRALALFRQICAGLAAAHAQQVVHRDLKPHNVLVGKDDRVRVCDFGLARLSGGEGWTAPGELVGTPAYVSPEQVKGEPTDTRSDIYSLGVILYQLVTGQPPFQGDTPHAVMEMRLHVQPRSVGKVTPDAPSHLDRVIRCCLKVDRADRYPSVGDLLDDLDRASGSGDAPASRSRRRWAAAAACGVVAVGAGATYVAWPRDPSHPGESAPAPIASPPATARSETRPTKVLVLGFDNGTGDPVFDSTLSTLLHGALRRSPLLDPVTTTRLDTLAPELGSGVAIDEHLPAKLKGKVQGRVLAVRGSVRSKGAGCSISILVRDSDDKVVLERTLEAPTFADAVATTAKLGAAVREMVGEQVAPGEATRHGLSQLLEADHEFAVGLSMLDVNDLEGATTHLERAVALDPEFATAHAVLSIAYSNAARQVEAEQQETLALRWAERMDERDRLRFLGDYYYTVTEEYERSVLELEQLLAKWPDDVGALSALASTHQANGNIAKAIEVGRVAAERYPRFLIARCNLPIYEIMAGQYDRAIADLERVLVDFPRPLVATHMYIAVASLFSGHRDRAVAAYAKLRELDPSAGATALADFALAEGRVAEATRLLEEGLADDLAHGAADAADVKREMLAEARLRHGDRAGARDMAALVTKEPPRLFGAALVQLAIGDDKRALATAARFGGEVAPSRRGLGKLIEAEAQRVHGKPEQAMATLQAAFHLNDHPFGHFLLARAALDAKHYDDASRELELCIRRRAEAAIGNDDVPWYRSVPTFTYYLAEVQRGLGKPDAARTYRAFLEQMHDADPTDPLVAAARRYASP